MKKLTLVFIMIVSATMVMAQGKIVSKYFEQFADNDQFVKVSVSAKMFSLFTELEAGSPEEEEFLKAVSKLKGMKMVVGDSVPDSRKYYNQAIKDVEGAGFEELMSVIDAEENVMFSIKESGGKIEELMMVAGGNEKFVVLSLYGEIDLKNISKIARSMSIDGLSDLEKLDESGN